MTAAYTDDQLEAGIVNALKAQDLEAVVAILECLASQNLDRAALIYTGLETGIVYSKVASILGGGPEEGT